MSLFEYKAVDAQGRMVLGRIEASNDADLEMRLNNMGLDMIRCRPARLRSLRFGSGRVGRQELINFCFHLEQLTRAGVPILDGLKDLRDSVDNPRFRDVIGAITEDIEGGHTLSEALARFPEIFGRVFVALIRAGERSGMLSDVLRELTENLKWQDELAAHTKKIVMYPAFVGVVVLGVIFFLMSYLVPQLTTFIRTMGEELPLHTVALIHTSRAFTEYWYLVIGIPVASLLLLRYLARVSPTVRYRVDDWKLRIWPVGPILRKIILARFASNFALMYAAGITVLDCIRTGQELAGNVVVEQALERVQHQIAEGVGLSNSFENTGLFPPLVIRMLRVGEHSGALDNALNNISYFYNRDVRESIEKVQSMIEPTLTVVLGALLGWVMFSVLGPIYDIMSRLQT